MPFGLSLDMTLGSTALSKGVLAKTPISILGASLLAWWTADRADLITLNGSAVTSWKDVMHGYDAVQGVSASRPVYSATSFNGSPGLTFDGSDDGLICTDAALLGLLPDAAEAGEMWAIVQQDALAEVASSRNILSYGGTGISTQRRIRRVVASGVNRGRFTVGTGASSLAATDTSVNFNSRHVIRGAADADSIDLSVDAATPISISGVPATSSAIACTIGSSSNTTATEFWHGKIRDVIITAGTLSPDQVTALNAWALPRRRL